MDCFRRLDISGLLGLRSPAVFHVIPTHRVIIDWPRAPLNHQELMDLRTITKDAWSQFTSVSKTWAGNKGRGCWLLEGPCGYLGIFVSREAVTKYHKAAVFKKQNLYSLTVLEGRIPKSRCQRGQVPPDGPREESSCASHCQWLLVILAFLDLDSVQSSSVA